MTDLQQRARALGLNGLVAHWDECDPTRAGQLIAWEESERTRRSQEGRLSHARLGRFKPLADFDWSWPRQCDRTAIEALMQLDFINEARNPILIGPNGVGKTTIAQNIAHQAVRAGHSARFTTAAAMLGDLAAQDSDRALKLRLQHYLRPTLLAIDEVGYLSYSNRHADLLFEIVSRRYEQKSTLVTTNRRFADWNEVFPNAPCVVSLVDRLIHHADIIAIDADSYRLKEANERSEQRKRSKPCARRASTDKTGLPCPASPDETVRDPRRLDCAAGTRPGRPAR